MKIELFGDDAVDVDWDADDPRASCAGDDDAAVASE